MYLFSIDISGLIRTEFIPPINWWAFLWEDCKLYGMSLIFSSPFDIVFTLIMSLSRVERFQVSRLDNWIFHDACCKAQEIFKEKQTIPSIIVAYSISRCYTIPLFDLNPESVTCQRNFQLLLKLFAVWGVEHYIVMTECWLDPLKQKDGLSVTSINHERKVMVLYEIERGEVLSLKEQQRIDDSKEDVVLMGFLLKLLPPKGFHLDLPQNEIKELLSALQYRVEEVAFSNTLH